MTNRAQDGEGWTVCPRTDVTSLRVFVVLVLIWSVKGIRVYGKSELRDDVGTGLPSCLHLSRGKNTMSIPINHISVRIES